MKKFLSTLFISALLITTAAVARTTYNPDNTINVSDTIRGQKKLREERIAEKKKLQRAAAAAKLNYKELEQNLDSNPISNSNNVNLKK